MEINTVDTNPSILSPLSSSATATPGTLNGIGDEAEGIWSADIEQSFLEALAIYPPCGRRKIILTEEGKMYGRNELVARYIKIRTGKTRSRKQVSSHLQVLAKRRSKELQFLRNDKASQQVILDRLKRYTSAEIVSMHGEPTASDNESNSDEDDDDDGEANERKKKPGNSPIKNLLHSIPVDEKATTPLSVRTADRLSLKDDSPAMPASHLSPMITPTIKKKPKKKAASTTPLRGLVSAVIHNSIPQLLPISPTVYSHDAARSRSLSNTSSSSPSSSGSTGSQGIMVTNPASLPLASIGDDNFRLYELNAFVEVKRTPGLTHPSLIYPPSEAYGAYQHDLLRLHANDIQMKNTHTFETISIDQIFDKFPRRDGLKDLFEHNPDGSFFLIKFWADVLMPPAIVNAGSNRDESFFTSYSFASCVNRPINVSTRLCSFGRQVLEKVEINEHPQRDPVDQYIYRFDRAALCDYMVQFIQKLRSLRKADLMNCVLENFTVLQVIKHIDNPEQLLLCIAFVFEIAMLDTGGPQYQVYKLVAN